MSNRKFILLVVFLHVVAGLKAQFVSRLEIVPAYSCTLFDMDITQHDRGIAIKQRNRPQANTMSLALRYRINQCYQVIYGFGIHHFANTELTSAVHDDRQHSPQEVSGFSNNLGINFYPFPNRDKFRPYLYLGMAHHAVKLQRMEIDYRFEIPAKGVDELPTTVSFSHPAYNGDAGGFGGELLIGFNTLDSERFGVTLSLGTAAFYQRHTAFLPRLVYVPRAQLGLVFRTLKTKMPL